MENTERVTHLEAQAGCQLMDGWEGHPGPHTSEGRCVLKGAMERPEVQCLPHNEWKDWNKHGSVAKKLPAHAGNVGSIPDPGRPHMLQGN